MVLDDATAPMPRYVLLNGVGPLGPSIGPADTGCERLVVYGFSDKVAYDLYRQQSEQSLTPYPLVKQYLRNHIQASDDQLAIVAIDPSSSRDACVRAATMEAVLKAQESRVSQVQVSHCMTLDEESNAYVVSEWQL